MPLLYYLASPVRGGVSNTICLRVCLSVPPPDWRLFASRSLAPNPGPTPGRRWGEEGLLCSVPAREPDAVGRGPFRGARWERCGTRCGAQPSAKYTASRDPPTPARPPPSGRTCPGGSQPNGREARPAPHSLWSTSRRGFSRGTKRSLQASGRPPSLLCPRPRGPPPLCSPPQHLSELQGLGVELGAGG